MATAPSGAQHEIAWGDQRATVVEVGAGLRAYDVGRRAVVQPYRAEAVCDGAHGAVLAPWPNRLGDGRYRFDGADHQVALSEPAKGNAIHGLVRWLRWEPVEVHRDRVALRVETVPQPGYPFSVELVVSYVVDAEGLTVTTTATNRGAARAPYGSGQHPYLSPGSGTVDDCLVRVDAATRITTDPERQLPIGTEAVDGTPYDLRERRPLGDLVLDDPFTDLERDGDGLAWAQLTGPDGRTAELWVDERYPVLQLYTADSLAPERRRRGFAAEPMTCPPDAFRTGDHLVVLAPGQSHTASWGVRLR